jgi:predicted dehydrogenase
MTLNANTISTLFAVSSMKAIIFGLGSIGKRHMRLLLDYFPEIEVWHYSRGDYFKEIGPCYEKLIDKSRWEPVSLSLNQDDFAIISNPTEAHLSTAHTAAELGLNLFMEKPIGLSTQGLSHLIALVQSNKLVAYVAYPLRFHPFIQYLKENPKPGRYHFECRSDASKWPSARKLDHVVLELSHEIDLAQHILGPIRRITGGGSDRWAGLVMEHDNARVSSAYLDIASPVEARSITIGSNWYPLEVNNYLYLSQLIQFINHPISNLEESANLLQVMEEYLGSRT